MLPTVSIVLPTYNRLDYLRAAVASVFAQSFVDWELLIADDGSDDETLTYLATLESESRVRLLRLDHTGNPGAARNSALGQARGHYVAFLDSDDLWAQDKLQIQLAVHQRFPERRWSYTALQRIDAAGAAIPETPGFKRRLGEGCIFSSLLTIDIAVATPSVMVERELLAQSGGFDETQRFFEDYDLWMRLSLLSEVSAIDRPLTLVRSHHHHYSADRAAVYEARFQLLDKVALLPDMTALSSLLRLERAKNAQALALVLAASGRRLEALRMLWNSRACSRRQVWWNRTALILAVVSSPQPLRQVLRKRRRAAVRTPAPA